MHRTYALLLAAAVLTSLAGCASLSKSQCLASDWTTIGYRDGLNGTQSTALMRHQNACVKYGVVPDREAYLAGWYQGVEQYCQPANGFATGEAGAGYSNVCPLHLQDAFRAAYQDGRALYLARSEIHSLQAAITQHEQRVREIEAELAGIAGGMLDTESTVADRAALLITAKDLAEEKGRLETEIDELEAEVATKTDQLESLQQTLAYAH